MKAFLCNNSFLSPYQSEAAIGEQLGISVSFMNQFLVGVVYLVVKGVFTSKNIQILTVESSNFPCFLEARLFSQFYLKWRRVGCEVLVPSFNYGHIHVTGIFTHLRYRWHHIRSVVVEVFQMNDQCAGAGGWWAACKCTKYTCIRVGNREQCSLIQNTKFTALLYAAMAIALRECEL